MKKVLPIIVILVVFLSHVPAASAYGGGVGFPPGYFDNLHPKVKLVCVMVKKQLPNNREITVPKCHVEKVTAKKNDVKKDIKQRINDFIARVRTGGK